MRNTSRLVAFSSILLLVACVDHADDRAPTHADVVPSALEIETTDTSAIGSFGAKDGLVRFGVDVVGAAVYDMWVDVNGLHLTLLVDAQAGVMEWDGYTAADGSVTQMTEADRAALLELYGAMESLGSDREHVSLLRRKIGNWAEVSDTMDLRWQKLFDREHGWTSLCGSCRTWRSGTHDCNHGGFNSDATTAYAYIRYEGAACGGDGSAYGTSSSVSCVAEPNGYTTIEYVRYNCLGRCGPGCSSGDTQFTQDCLNHDMCVRGGHALASAYCDDQLVSAGDDDVSAPHCGTGC